MSKAEEIRDMIKRSAAEAMAVCCAEMSNREQAEVIRSNRSYLAAQIAWHLTEQYRLLELMDIVEWKRQRVRR